jgi:hypothetical protein
VGITAADEVMGGGILPNGCRLFEVRCLHVPFYDQTPYDSKNFAMQTIYGFFLSCKLEVTVPLRLFKD